MIDPQITIGTVALNVTNLDMMTAFYRDVVGLRVHTFSAENVTLGTSTRALVRLRHLPIGRSNQRSSGLYHVALRVYQRAGRWRNGYAAMSR